MIVGNFYRAANADIMDQRNNPNLTIDILVDDISVVKTKGTNCAGYQKTKDSLYAILRRHSDKHPGDTAPDVSDTPPDTTEKTIVSPPAPLRVIDTPKSPHRPLPTDTIIIHNIQFDFDKYLVQNPDTLQRYQRLLTGPGIKKIQVVGFTDDIGSETYNLDLSKKRAGEVAHLLTSKFNISPALIEAEGRGISTVYPTRDLNRRVEIYIFHE
jgi:outer membrane protein OmpA-like peptidoglycan-associated protein